MGTFLIAAFISIIWFWICLKNNIKGLTFSTVFGIILIAMALLQLGLPGKDIGRELASQTELVSLTDGISSSGTGGLFYVRVNADNSYSYYYEVDSEYKQSPQDKSYKQGIVTGEDVIIIECENAEEEVPALYVYHTGTADTFWTIGNQDKYEYVFRVPKGTILQQFQLNS